MGPQKPRMFPLRIPIEEMPVVATIPVVPATDDPIGAAMLNPFRPTVTSEAVITMLLVLAGTVRLPDSL